MKLLKPWDQLERGREMTTRECREVERKKVVEKGLGSGGGVKGSKKGGRHGDRKKS